MNLFICMFTPSIIALLRYEKVSKVKYDYKYSLCIYLVFSLLINCLTTVLCYKLFNIKANSSIEAFIKNNCFFGIKYVIIAVLLAFILPSVINFIYKNVKIRIIVRGGGKNAKTKKNIKN